MGYPGRQNIYEAAIRRMVAQAIAEQEQAFREQHETDTDGQLLAYLRACAVSLRHTPWPSEILGGVMIQERFGSWERAVLLAGLSKPYGSPKNNLRIQEETERQRECYRKKKAEKKVQAQKRMAQQAARKKKSESS